MPSGWDVYYVVFLSAALALGIPAGLSALAALIRANSPPNFGGPRPRVGGSVRLEVGSSGDSANAQSGGAEAELLLGRRLNARFFRGANAALLLIAVGLILIPCVISAAERGLIGILSLAGFATLGLLYAARKGDLDWLRGHQDGDQP